MSEPRRWWIEDNEANREVPADVAKPRYVEVIAVEDHDRIMAERDELWKRATKFVMPGEMDTGESIEHYIKTLEQTVAELRAEVEKHNALHEYATKAVEQLKARIDNQAFILSENTKTIATQARVIEKLKATVDGTILYVNLAGAEYLREQADELAAITKFEKEGAKDE